jgi:hypothetical protein
MRTEDAVRDRIGQCLEYRSWASPISLLVLCSDLAPVEEVWRVLTNLAHAGWVLLDTDHCSLTPGGRQGLGLRQDAPSRCPLAEGASEPCWDGCTRQHVAPVSLRERALHTSTDPATLRNPRG